MLVCSETFAWKLMPEMEHEFDLEFKGVEKNGIGNNKLQSLISVLRQAHESTVHFDFFKSQGIYYQCGVSFSLE